MTVTAHPDSAPRRLWRMLMACVPVAVLLAAAGFGAWHHEMWRDEAQAWLLARDSAFPWDLVRNARYEGHPLLWHMGLWVLSRFTELPQPMQVYHLAIAAFAVAVVARYAPFSFAEKLLFSMGYLVAYEYAVICRNYGLGMLLLVVFCVLYARRYQRLPALTATLFLLSQTSVHALLLAIAAGIVVFLEVLCHRRADDAVPLRVALPCLAALLLGYALAVLQVHPPPDSGFATGWHWEWDPSRAAEVAKLICRAYVPWPPNRLGYWNNVAYDGAAWFRAYGTTLALASVGFVALLLARRPMAMLFYLGGTASLLAFFYVKHWGSMRHHGFLFLCLLAGSWMSLADRRPPACARLTGLDRIVRGVHRVVLAGLLAIQAGAGWRALSLEAQYCFSGGQPAGAYLRASGLYKLPAVTGNGPEASTVVAYAGIPEIYDATSRRMESYLVWDSGWGGHTDGEALVQRAREWRDGAPGPVLLLLAMPLKAHVLRRHGIRELYRTGPAVCGECYCLYLLPDEAGL